MPEGDVQSVLRCGQCNKPFDKQSTLKRHGYYCRSRKAGSTNRARSCISCARGKARCDNRRPECSRCVAKAIECHYPANTRKDAEPRFQYSDNAPTEQQRTPPSVTNPPGVDMSQEPNNNSDIMLDTTLQMPFTDLGEGYLDWNDPEVNFADFLNPQTVDESAQYPSPESSSMVCHSTPMTDHAGQEPPSFITMPPTISTYLRRSLILRPKMMTGAKRTANLILSTLKSYPQMMLHHNTFPPFIHPLLRSSAREMDQMEPLSNCISLVHMIKSGVHGSRKLFWKNVRMECERLREEHLRLNKWGLLAAMQALSIYILIRLCEGETEHNNFDVLLLGTVTIISKQIICSDIMWNTQSAVSNYGIETSWKEWLFEESRRRLAVVYRVVNMLVYFEPASLCELQADLIIAPLPARKKLWEASDGFAWKAETESDPGAHDAFGLAANGELVQLEDCRSYCSATVLNYKSLEVSTSPRDAAPWESWCSGMDGFGGLVMLAATLVG
ncbi:hypothetical protein K458DRAFT_381593 [Lentithecium fluviatile CBS 122367]|uniref:Zn(2)-C6 fungal-type domain-containing protein n=1 Tax=Lentithecium fluviatile CBS 122367 TaxID=1168545 RepID=A0A6G1JNL7_9PLEO|nr:hypothetical protein K458DRAFT_381593 [Lentithecium fluviatile CBS 122367]